MNNFIGTSFHGDVIITSYNELVNALGEPTYSETSGDGKVQKEWNLVTDDDVFFTIYDWKEYDRDVTDGYNVEWHVGHCNNDGDIKSITRWLAEHNVNVIAR